MKTAQTQNISQSVEQVKTQINDSVNSLNTTMQQIQEGVKKMQDLMQNVEQLEVQVQSLQQAQQQQQTAQPMQADDQANDAAWWQKMWAKMQDAVGGGTEDDDEYNSVAGVRGSTKTNDLFVATAKGKKKKQKHLTPRDSEHNKDLPDFWRKNYDYGESPYMNLDKIDKITDEVPHGKRKKKS